MKKTYKISSKFFFFPFFVFIIYCSIFIVHCNAQPSITWQRSYDGPGHFEDDGNDICPASDGNFYALGSTLGVNHTYFSPYLLKLDPYGNVIWSLVVSQISGYAYAVVPCTDGGCIFSGFSGFGTAVKVSSEGQIVWKNKFGIGPSSKFIENMIRTSDGNIIGCGYDGGSESDSAYIFKIDTDGNLLWQRHYSGNYKKYFYEIIETDDSNYVTIGTDLSFSGTPNTVVVKIDRQGKVIWQKYQSVFDNFYGTAGYSINKLGNGFFISGQAFDTVSHTLASFVARINTSGEILFAKYFNTNLNEYDADSKVFSSNKIILTSFKDPPNGYFIAYNRIIDTIGNIKTEVSYPVSPGGSNFRRILLLNNKDIMFIGTCQTSLLIGQDFFVIRTDSMLNSPPIGIINSGNNLPSEFRLFQNYPNPFNPVTKINYEIPKKGNINLFIYDVLGCEVMKLVYNEFKQAGSYSVSFDGTHLASGVYFYRIEAGDFVQSKKMVLIK